MSTATNVSVGKPKVGGAVFRAPLGTTLPTDATTALAAAFVGLGYVSEDGLTNTNTLETEDYKAWGGDTVLQMDTDSADRFQFASIEALNPEVLKAYYGDANVTGDLATGITVSVKPGSDSGHVWVFDMIMRDGALKRVVIPNGVISEKGDIVYVDDEPIAYQMTITANADASGNSHYEYIVKPAA